MSFDEKEPIRAVGYTSLTSPAHIHDPDFVRQEVAIERFCLQRDWELVTCLRDIESRRSRAWSRPALIQAVERVRRGDATCQSCRLMKTVKTHGKTMTAMMTAIAGTTNRRYLSRRAYEEEVRFNAPRPRVCPHPNPSPTAVGEGGKPLSPRTGRGVGVRGVTANSAPESVGTARSPLPVPWPGRRR